MSDATHMQCMEVWGGSELTARNVQMGGLDAWIYSKPFGQAKDGGDVYYASSCATGRISRLLLADVAGHGNAVVETATVLRKLMRRFVNFLDQAEFVRSMNRQFVELSGDGCFATAVVTTFFAPTRRFSICNAGHPRPLHYRSSDKKWALLEDVEQGRDVTQDLHAQNIPLGIVDLADYEQLDIELDIHDLILCYTDALIESRDANGQMLGETGLLSVLQTMPNSSQPENLIDALLSEIGKIHSGNLTGDDVTVLLLRPNGNRPQYTVGEKLRAMMQMAGALIRSANPRAERAPMPDFNLANIGGAIFPPLARRWRARKTAAIKTG